MFTQPKKTKREERSEMCMQTPQIPASKDQDNCILQKFTVTAIACPTGISFEPSGTRIFAK